MNNDSIIKIHLEIAGPLYIEAVDKKSSLFVDNGTTISGLLEKLHVSKSHKPFISVFINGVEKKRSKILNDGDKVKLFLPTGGG